MGEARARTRSAEQRREPRLSSGGRGNTKVELPPAPKLAASRLASLLHARSFLPSCLTHLTTPCLLGRLPLPQVPARAAPASPSLSRRAATGRSCARCAAAAAFLPGARADFCCRRSHPAATSPRPSDDVRCHAPSHPAALCVSTLRPQARRRPPRCRGLPRISRLKIWRSCALPARMRLRALLRRSE